MCCDEKLFSELHPEKETDVTLGDGHTLQATGQGTVPLVMNLPDGSSSTCCLLEVLFVPSLSYNLVSVSKAAERGKDATFDQDSCKIVSKSGHIVARAHQRGSLYYLDCRAAERVTITQSPNQTTLWHQRFGHLSGQALHKLSRNKLVHGLNCTLSDQVGFC